MLQQTSPDQVNEAPAPARGKWRPLVCPDCSTVVERAYANRKRCKRCAGRRATLRSSLAARRARQLVKYAVAKGRLKRRAKCQDCHKPCRTHGHHFAGYSRKNALRVRWLCAQCHRAEHWHQNWLRSIRRSIPALAAFVDARGGGRKGARKSVDLYWRIRERAEAPR